MKTKLITSLLAVAMLFTGSAFANNTNTAETVAVTSSATQDKQEDKSLGLPPELTRDLIKVDNRNQFETAVAWTYYQVVNVIYEIAYWTGPTCQSDEECNLFVDIWDTGKTAVFNFVNFAAVYGIVKVGAKGRSVYEALTKDGLVNFAKLGGITVLATHVGMEVGDLWDELRLKDISEFKRDREILEMKIKLSSDLVSIADVTRLAQATPNGTELIRSLQLVNDKLGELKTLRKAQQDSQLDELRDQQRKELGVDQPAGR